jgi:hypothetical protein
MPGSNPEVQGVFLVRQYDIKDTTDADFAHSPDMAVIGHHPRTGASAYLQFYDPERPKSSSIVRSPFGEEGPDFWSPIDSLADSFRCQRCHTAGPFIHTPWINQVTIGEGAAKEAMVPSDPVGPFFFVDAEEAERFWSWDSALVASKGGGHLNKPANHCTQCHRVAPDMIGLNQNSTRYTGLDSADHNAFSIRSDGFQTAHFDSLYWMPPADPAMIDFYAGQTAIPRSSWSQTYAASAAEVNRLMHDSASWVGAHQAGLVADVPRPPEEHRTVLVDRPSLDPIAPGESLWIVDSRIRANTDGDLEAWRFFARGPGGAGVTASPVVLRRRWNDGSTLRFDVVFVGEPRRASDAGDFVTMRANAAFGVRQGDYLGVVFTNGAAAAGTSFIPFSDDDWAVLRRSDGSTWLRDGSVTYRAATDAAPSVGQVLTAGEGAFRTYSFEFRNRLAGN